MAIIYFFNIKLSGTYIYFSVYNFFFFMLENVKCNIIKEQKKKSDEWVTLDYCILKV